MKRNGMSSLETDPVNKTEEGLFDLKKYLIQVDNIIQSPIHSDISQEFILATGVHYFNQHNAQLSNIENHHLIENAKHLFIFINKLGYTSELEHHICETMCDNHQRNNLSTYQLIYLFRYLKDINKINDLWCNQYNKLPINFLWFIIPFIITQTTENITKTKLPADVSKLLKLLYWNLNFNKSNYNVDDYIYSKLMSMCNILTNLCCNINTIYRCLNICCKLVFYIKLLDSQTIKNSQFIPVGVIKTKIEDVLAKCDE